MAIDLLALLFLELVAKDWLFSSADPYPYEQAFSITLAALAMFLSGISGGAAARCAQALFPTRSAEPPETCRPPALLGLAVAIAALAGAAVAWRNFVPANLLHASSDDWLGAGLGAGPAATTFAAQLAGDWGIAASIVALLLTVAAFACAASTLLDRRIAVGQAWRIILSATGVAALCALLIDGLREPAFLTVDTADGTWAYALSIAAIRIAAAPAASLPDGARVHAPMRRKGAVFGAALAAVAAAVFAAHAALARIVGPRVAQQLTVAAPFSTISQPMQDATIAMEDGHFYKHHGFDFVAMHRALRKDIRDGRIEQGGSTITQQLAKNLFLTGDRTLWRKFVEAAYTIELEHELSKSQILRLYLSCIDYGCGQRGIGAAARYYFHKEPAQLTVAESAVLVGIVPHPDLCPAGQPPDLQQMATGEQTALSRMAFFFARRYSPERMDIEKSVPLDRLVYPYKDAWDRGATDIIPETWRGVSFYFYASPDTPGAISQAAPCLKERMAGFLDEARETLHIVGIDHLGCYNDRPMRQSQTVLSAHAYGQAIDISGFRFADGRRIRVADHAIPSVASALAPIENLLKHHFDIVVDWRSDPLRHQTHYHCEVRGPRRAGPRSPYQPGSEDALVQRIAHGPHEAPPYWPIIEHQEFESRCMGDRFWGFNIFLPPNYYDPAASHIRYPVIYFCHGYGDDEYTNIRRGLPYRLQAAMVSGRAPEMIMVFLNGERDSSFSNIDIADRVESYVVKELVPYVDLHYRTIASRQGRAVEGFSMGGYGALKFAYRYPWCFGDVVSYSAATYMAKSEDDDLAEIVRRNAAVLQRCMRIRLVVGLAGDGTLDAVQEHHALLARLHIPCDYEEVPGVGHSIIGLYDASDGDVGLRGLMFHAASFFGGELTPGDLAAVASSGRSVSLSWCSVPGATGYRIFRAAAPDGRFSRVGETALTTYCDRPSILPAGGLFYRVEAEGARGVSGRFRGWPVLRTTDVRAQRLASAGG